MVQLFLNGAFEFAPRQMEIRLDPPGWVASFYVVALPALFDGFWIALGETFMKIVPPFAPMIEALFQFLGLVKCPKPRLDVIKGGMGNE